MVFLAYKVKRRTVNPDNRVRSPKTPKYLCRLTDKPKRYERFIEGSNPTKGTKF